MKTQSASNIFKVGILGAVSGITIFLVFSWLPFSIYISSSIIGLLFSVVLILPYDNGVKFTSIKNIATKPKSIIIIIISIAIAIIITVLLVRLIPWRGLFGIEIVTGASLAAIILGVITFILFNLKGRFSYPKWTIKHSNSMFSNSKFRKYNYKITSRFPNTCVYCGNNSDSIVEMKFDFSTNVWAHFFTKGKKMEPAKIPYCSEHARESKMYSQILFLSYLIPFILIIIINLIYYFVHTTKIELFNILALPIFAHLISCLIQLGVKITLTPFFKTINSVPLHFISYGIVGTLLGIKIKLSLSNGQVKYKLINQTFAHEFEKINI